MAEDQYLMEVSLGDLQVFTREWHKYWLLAIKAARVAGRLLAGCLRLMEQTMGSPYHKKVKVRLLVVPLYTWEFPWHHCLAGVPLANKDSNYWLK